MRSWRSLFLFLTLSIHALWLTGCGDDDAPVPPAARCDAGCEDAVAEPDPAPRADSGEPADSSSEPDVPDATPELDAAPDASGAPIDAGADAGDDESTLDGSSDAGGALDATADGGATPDSGATPDVGADAGASPDAGTDAGPDAGPAFVPVLFSATDKGASAYLSADRLSVENRGADVGNVRSDSALAPGSGVFYFEGHREIDTTGFYGMGIATAAASLSGEIGATSASLGLTTDGSFWDTGATCALQSGFQNPQAKRDYGFVIDYRGANPRVIYVLDDGAGGVEVRRKCNTTITAPVFAFYYGARWEVGYQFSINTGADTVNLPFHFTLAQVQGALNAAGESSAASALVYGFGKTRARPRSASPVLVAPADRTVAAGTSVTLTGTASDAEDGDLTARIAWTDLSSQHHAPVTGTGGSFTFTPALGRHPVRIRVVDAVGRSDEHTVMITATGTLPQPNPVRMVTDALSGDDTDISPDGLSVDVHAAIKNGVRANQGIYGQYWYFEAHRNGASNNEGVGLVIPDGDLAPYDFVNVPWSMSINLSGSTWYNLNSLAAWPDTNDHYGFAVDYRGLHPIVHVIIGGAFHRSVVMKDVWGPVYPMVYGNPFYDPPSLDPGYDISVNFGASAFRYDPAFILGAQSIDVTGLELGWGDANTP